MVCVYMHGVPSYCLVCYYLSLCLNKEPLIEPMTLKRADVVFLGGHIIRTRQDFSV